MRYCGPLRNDMNGDGKTTISDLWEALWWLICWPGDTLIGWMGQSEKPAAFFEITWQSCQTWKSFFISLVFYFFCLFVLALLEAIGKTIGRAMGFRVD